MYYRRPFLLRSGFSLIELMVVIAVVAILATVLIPTIQAVRSKAVSVECVNNLRQIGGYISIYIGEHDGHLPTWTTWTQGGNNWLWDNYHLNYRADGTPNGGVLPEMAGYYPGGIMTQTDYNAAGSKNIFNCPANESLTSSKGYAANRFVMRSVNASRPHYGGMPVTEMVYPSRLMMITDNHIESNSLRWFLENDWDRALGTHRHGDGAANVLFADLSVGKMRKEDVKRGNLDPAVLTLD